MPFRSWWSCPSSGPGTASLSSGTHQLPLIGPPHLLHWWCCLCLTRCPFGCFKRPHWQTPICLHWTMAHHSNPQRCVIQTWALLHAKPQGEKACFQIITVPPRAHPIQTSWGLWHLIWSTPQAYLSKLIQRDRNWRVQTIVTIQSPGKLPHDWHCSCLSLAQPLGTQRQNCSIPMVVGGWTPSLPFRWHSLDPSGPTYPLPDIPELTILTWSIIQSSDQLFFISHSVGSNKALKWHLVQVALKESMSSYPSCLQDGRFLLNFFIFHPSNSRINAINQCYWLQYHTLSKLQSPLTTTDTHLICPTDTLVDYAQYHKLCPFQKWLNLAHLDTFIHGPFDFASVHGWKTQDPVSQADWDVLKLHLDMFHNPFPHFNVPSYSIHIDWGMHVWFHDAALSRQLVLVASHATDSPGTPTCQWQKVIASEQTTTPVFFFLIHHDNGASSEVWHAEVDYLNIHFTGESEKWEIWNTMTNLWHLDCTFGPCLACDPAHLVKYFWAA